MRFTKIKWLNILLNIFFIVVLPALLGVVLYVYLEYAILLVGLVPMFFVFLFGGMKNGSNMS